MLVPVLIYTSINPERYALNGRGIPMVIDIALGALVLLVIRIPKSPRTFLVAFAIMDDPGFR